MLSGRSCLDDVAIGEARASRGGPVSSVRHRGGVLETSRRGPPPRGGIVTASGDVDGGGMLPHRAVFGLTVARGPISHSNVSLL